MNIKETKDNINEIQDFSNKVLLNYVAYPLIYYL